MRALAEKIAAEVAEQFSFGGDTEPGERYDYINDMVENELKNYFNSHQPSFGEGPVDCQTAQAINDLHHMGFRWSVGYDPNNAEYVVAGVHTTSTGCGTIIVKDDTLFAAVKRAQTNFTAFEDMRNAQDNDN